MIVKSRVENVQWFRLDVSSSLWQTSSFYSAETWIFFMRESNPRDLIFRKEGKRFLFSKNNIKANLQFPFWFGLDILLIAIFLDSSLFDESLIENLLIFGRYQIVCDPSFHDFWTSSGDFWITLFLVPCLTLSFLMSC